MGKKVLIELTPDQKDKIRHETGQNVSSFTYEALENRDAPKAFGAGGSADEPVDLNDGKPRGPR